MGLFGFGKKHEPSFAEHVDKFWGEFEKSIDEIKALMDAKDYEMLAEKVEEKLQICLAEPFFLIGEQDGKLDLVLTPEGMKHRLFWLNFIKQRMPETLKSKMVATLGKQRSPRAMGLQMYDIDINAQGTKVAANYVEGGVEIELYEPNLAKLLADDEDKAYNLSYILTDNIIGEIACMNLIKNLEILSEPKPDMITLEDFTDELYNKFGEKAAHDPQKSFSVYRLEPQGESERADVVVGSTCLMNLIGEYMNGESEIFDEGADNNVRFCYLAISHGGDMQTGFDLRKGIEDDEFFDKFAPFIEHIGGAAGTNFAYIDLISFDPAKLDELVNGIGKKYGVKISVCDFKR